MAGFDYNRSDVDPITLVYEALWYLLESSPHFTSRVKSGNRMKFIGKNVDPLKDHIRDMDIPEVRIIPTSIEPHMQRTSNSSSMWKRFEIQIATGDQSLDNPAALFPVEWALVLAMSNWFTHLQQLTWKGRKIVVRFRIPEVSEGVSDQDLNRGIKGWSAVWACEIELWFTTTDLQGE